MDRVSSHEPRMLPWICVFVFAMGLVFRVFRLVAGWWLAGWLVTWLCYFILVGDTSTLSIVIRGAERPRGTPRPPKHLSVRDYLRVREVPPDLRHLESMPEKVNFEPKSNRKSIGKTQSKMYLKYKGKKFKIQASAISKRPRGTFW